MRCAGTTTSWNFSPPRWTAGRSPPNWPGSSTRCWTGRYRSSTSGPSLMGWAMCCSNTPSGCLHSMLSSCGHSQCWRGWPSLPTPTTSFWVLHTRTWPAAYCWIQPRNSGRPWRRWCCTRMGGSGGRGWTTCCGRAASPPPSPPTSSGSLGNTYAPTTGPPSGFPWWRKWHASSTPMLLTGRAIRWRRARGGGWRSASCRCSGGSASWRCVRSACWPW
mmetsp:Transcript_16397/g.49143  ORF Transcript_16397/g.49143 Transcript_16397/m.49143 type:complete len:218 (-) Transcript_16397:419-1072(-)